MLCCDVMNTDTARGKAEVQRVEDLPQKSALPSHGKATAHELRFKWRFRLFIQKIMLTSASNGI